MEYRYTDTEAATITLTLTLSDVAAMRAMLEAASKIEVENVSRWRVRDFVRTLATAQGKAAEVLAMEAKALADKAKLADDF